MCWVSLCLWLFKIVVRILSANCLYDTPTWVFNMHIKLHLPKVELLVTPQPTKNLLSHLPGCSRKTPRVMLYSSLSLSPQALYQRFLLILILLPKCVTKSLSSSHHCCYLPVQSPSFLLWTTALVFWPVSMLPHASAKQQESSFKGCPPPFKVISLFEVMSWFSTVVKLKSWPLYPESQSPLDPGPLPLWPQLLQLSLITVLQNPWLSGSLSKPARQPKGPLPSQNGISSSPQAELLLAFRTDSLDKFLMEIFPEHLIR